MRLANISSAVLRIALGVLYVIICGFFFCFSCREMKICEEKVGGRSGLTPGGCKCLPFDTADKITNPGFVIRDIRHPDGFDMKLIDESHLVGGSKQRIIAQKCRGLPDQVSELVYAGPSSGYAQVALSYCGRLLGKRITVFVDATQRDLAPLTDNAKLLGANIRYFNHKIRGKRLSYIQDQATRYASENRHRYLVPFGMHDTESANLYATRFAPLKKMANPKRLWVVAGSGLIFTALSKIFPETKLMIVQVGKKIYPDQLEGINCELFISDIPFTENIPEPHPPYNTPLSYDGKLWPFVLKHGQPGDFLWNTAGAPWSRESLERVDYDTRALLQSWSDVETQVANLTDTPFPYQHDAMEPPMTMFLKLKKETESRSWNSSEIHRNFSVNYYTTDGISNHYTEKERMKCVVNKFEKISPHKFWNTNRPQIASAAYRLGSGDPANFKPNWSEALRTMRSYKDCTTFNPCVLIATIKKYFPNQPIRILDPSMGWGDRLIGSLACGVSEYVGFDPNTTLHTGYDKINSELNLEKTPTTFLPHKFSKTELSERKIKTNFDLVFTSPPYYNFEIYEGSQQDTQKSYNNWLADLYIPYLQDMVKCARPGGYIAIYTSNIYGANIGDDTQRIVVEAGAEFVETLHLIHDYTDSNNITHKGTPRPVYVFKTAHAWPDPTDL